MGVTAARQHARSRCRRVAHHPPAGRVPPSRRRRGGGFRGDGASFSRYAYLRDPKAISRRSFALVRAEADLARFPRPLRRVAARIAHAAGDVAILDDLAWSPKAVAAGRGGARRGRADYRRCGDGEGRRHPRAPDRRQRNRARAARSRGGGDCRRATHDALGGGGRIVAALSGRCCGRDRQCADGAVPPARNPCGGSRANRRVILGFPVGFVGAAEAKAALAAFGRGVEFVTLHGRRGGSAIAAAAVNALASRAMTRWLAVVGIGEDGLAGLSRGGACLDRHRGGAGRRRAPSGDGARDRCRAPRVGVARSPPRSR